MLAGALVLPDTSVGIMEQSATRSASMPRTFVEPNISVKENQERLVVDGITFEFQIASGTEAPSEFTFLIEDYNTLCMAEVCTMTMHNILTLRGAEVRDPLLWAHAINEARELFGERCDTLVNSHNWPVWGAENVTTYLDEQRDIYKYIHDQTLRLANLGHTPIEIADLMPEPDWLSTKFHCRGYYGSLNHNVKATYQKYYGFFDGNPDNLDRLTPKQEGIEYVAALGGAEKVLELAQQAIADDKLKWAATILNNLVFAEPDNNAAKQHLAYVYDQLGYRAESSIWRNIYLSGAKELRHGVQPILGGPERNTDLAKTLSALDYFNSISVRLNPERSRGLNCKIKFNITDRQETIYVSVNRQTEFCVTDTCDQQVDLTIDVAKSELEALFAKQVTMEQLKANNAITIDGPQALMERYLEAHDSFTLWFNIVTP